MSSPAVLEVKLFSSASERTTYGNMEDLYSILVTTEMLEKAFIRESISAKKFALVPIIILILAGLIDFFVLSYTDACSKLIAQFKTLRDALNTPEKPFDFSGFIAQYGLRCPAAVTRLITVGVPATVEHGAMDRSTDHMDLHVVIAQAVAHFITAMDSLKLEMRAVDELQPHLHDLMTCLNKIVTLPSDHDTKVLGICIQIDCLFGRSTLVSRLQLSAGARVAVAIQAQLYASKR
jgi:ESCRT-I complex subunit VPS28